MTSYDIVQKFHLTVVGHGEPTLVFVHGFGSDQTSWRHQVADFCADHRVVLFDHLGCGKADVSDYHPRRYTSLESYAEDVLAIYEHLGLRDTVYVGHSVGAMIGLLASLARPEAFAKLVLLAGSPRYLNDGAYLGGFTEGDLNALYSVMMQDYLGWANGFAPLAMANGDRPELGREFARSLGAMRPDLAQSAARVIFASDYRDRLPEIQHPVLVLQPQSDLMVPLSVAEYLASQIPHSQFQILNAYGHLPHLSAPAEVTAAIRDFLAA
ncbi:MAG: alpha/beta hydrolase [Oscillochloris sp.]|nr:alpha/beta hydrolase [Oscillochloris sp.]